MKSILKLSIVTLTAVLTFDAYANTSLDAFDGTTCASKTKAIQTQIDYAKKYNNSYRIKGLEKALSDVNTYCTNDKLETKYKENVQEKTDKVNERMQELAQAKAKGDLSKIAKQEAKLVKDKAELAAAQTKLSQFYKDLKVK